MNVLAWFILKSVPGVGNLLFKRLIDHFKSPENVLQASHQELVQISGVSRRLADAILSHKTPDSVKRDLELALSKNYRIITQTDPDYPLLLHQIPDPPPFLYVHGCLDGKADYIAVVGSRNATSYGLTAGRRLCRGLGAMNFGIVSGMALGIDTAAHQGAMMGKGKTVAVLGSGLGNVYPRENLKLFHQIAENGAVISEFSVMTGPEAHNFPLRNRIICGMSHGTLVVEAAKKSGSLITARLAAEQGREVFAVPGSIYSFKSTGPHDLIKQGAKLTENVQDIVEELKHVIRDSDIPLNAGHNRTVACFKADQEGSLNPDEAGVLAVLEPYPAHIDDLSRKLSMKPGKLAGILLKLELMGMVIQSPGKRFSIKEEKS